MGTKEILNEINSLKKDIAILNTKMDKILKKQQDLEEAINKFKAIEDMLDTLPAKLNTASFQIISSFEESTNKISKNLEESINKSLDKMDKLIDVNKRLDVFEEDLKAYLAKIRAMLLELEDNIRR